MCKVLKFQRSVCRMSAVSLWNGWTEPGATPAVFAGGRRKVSGRFHGEEVSEGFSRRRGLSNDVNATEDSQATLYEALEQAALLDIHLDYIAEHPEAAR